MVCRITLTAAAAGMAISTPKSPNSAAPARKEKMMTGGGRLMVLNECDGRRFSRLRIGDRLFEGSGIPAWAGTTFDAVFESALLGIGMSLSPGEGETPDRCAVFCGREVGAGLDWAGLAIECPMPAFSYGVKLHVPAPFKGADESCGTCSFQISPRA